MEFFLPFMPRPVNLLLVLAVKAVSDPEKKAEKATDAGARAKRKLQRKVHAKYVSGSEDLVPDEMRD